MALRKLKKKKTALVQKILHKPACINISSVMRRPLETYAEINKCPRLACLVEED